MTILGRECNAKESSVPVAQEARSGAINTAAIDFALDSKGNVYTAEVGNGRRVQKLLLGG